MFLLQAHKLDGMAAVKRRLRLSGESVNMQKFLRDSLQPVSLQYVFDNQLTPFSSGNGFGCNVMDSYFSLLDLSFVENYHRSIFTTFEKQ